MLKDFIKVYEGYGASIENKKDFKMKYYFYNSFDDNFIINTLEKKFKKLLEESNNKNNYIKINSLIKEYINYHIIFGKENNSLLNFLYIINYFDEGYLLPNFKNERWIEIIKIGKSILSFKEEFSFEYITDTFQEQVNLAKSTAYLKNHKLKFNYSNEKIVLDKKSIKKGICILEDLINKYGGLNLISKIFNDLKYSKHMNLYLFPHNINIINDNNDLDIPYGYLLNLSLKHLNKTTQTNNIKLYEKIITFSKHLVNVLCLVQYYNPINLIYVDDNELFNYLKKIILWDSIYSVDQYNPIFVNDFLQFTLNKIKKYDDIHNLSFNIDIFKDFLEYIISLSNKNLSYIILDLRKDSNHKYSEMISILSNKKVNNHYYYPPDYYAITYWKKPFIQLNKKEYVFPTLSWSILNFYEFFLEEYRKINKDIDGKIGILIEEFIESILYKKGFTFYRGEYEEDHIKGECDFLLSGKKHIILLEVKKKVLTRHSKSGNEFNILVDLSKSLLDSQIQCGKIEKILLKNNQISLVDNSTIHNIKLNNREIIRVSIVFHDYHTLHNSLILTNFLKKIIFCDYGIESQDKSIKNKLKELDKKVKIWRNQY